MTSRLERQSPEHCGFASAQNETLDFQGNQGRELGTVCLLHLPDPDREMVLQLFENRI
ncbi:hypothetical protein MKX50_10520 [Paenibacillus sp. FSL W8-0186]|uniref:hypothetical protein n=1 Tax=Paenibacillus sp. FSL W8-0186 TaxID=2921709 RepID=UPI0030D4A347